jgi:hypothetical protein
VPTSVSWRRLLLSSLAAVVVLMVLVFVYQAIRTVTSLRAATNDAAALPAELRRGDLDAVLRTLEEVQRSAGTAHGHSDNVLWDALGVLPLIGDDVRAVQVLSRALDESSTGAAESAATVIRRLRQPDLRGPDGRLDLASVAEIGPPLRQVAAALDGPTREVDALDPDSLIGPLGGVATNVRDELDSTRARVRGAQTVVRLLPAMLGADGPRRYLLVVQDNAEIRSTGGLPGSFALLDADDGKLTLGARRSAADFRVLSSPVLPLSDGERAVYGDNLGENIRDTVLTPDFPRAAELMRALEERSFGTPVDGVVAVDPVTLADLLKVVGPVKIGNEVFTQRNVVPALLNEVYQRFGTREEQEVYFDTVARGILTRLLTTDTRPIRLLRRLGDAAGQRRLLVWSAHRDEQLLIRGAAISGRLPRDGGSTPHVGVYLNDGTAAKIEYYLDYHGGVRSSGCVAGRQTLQVGMVLDSSLPRRGYGVSRFITGNRAFSPIGIMKVNLRVYAPTGGRVTRLTASGRDLPIVTQEHDGRQVATVTMFIRARQEVRISATLTTRSGQTGDPILDWTPGVHTTRSSTTVSSSCG